MPDSTLELVFGLFEEFIMKPIINLIKLIFILPVFCLVFVLATCFGLLAGFYMSVVQPCLEWADYTLHKMTRKL